MSDESRSVPGFKQRRAGLWAPCLIVFFSGFCIMLIELVASQLVSGYIGRSLETWTAVIGVILAGITAGNYLGGILADRFQSLRLVATLFIFAAVLSASILFLVDPVGKATLAWGFEPGTNLKRILAVTFGVFFLPATVLGMISPAIVKWALDFGFATGTTVGTIYAWNTVGSILGTFLTGYYLVAWFDVQTIVLVASGGLLLAGLAFVPSILFGPSRVQPIDEMARTRVSLDNNRSEWQREGLIIPSSIVFASGFCVMLVEVVAGRLVAGHIGQSIYTWTSVIGVILAGITVGNYSGGKLADRFEAKSLVGALLLVASMLILTLLFSHLVIPNANEKWPTSAISWGNRVAIVCLAAFFLPSAALGTISPAVAKWALERRYASGQTVGTIYAWNTIGSICGTFATGFYLISMFYVSRLIAFSSLGLAVLGMLFLVSGGTSIARIVGTLWSVVVLLAVGLVCVPVNRFESTILAFPRPSAITLPASKAAEFQEQLQFIRESLASLQLKMADKDAPAALKNTDFQAWLRSKQELLLDQVAPELERALWTEPERELREKIKQVQKDAGFATNSKLVKEAAKAADNSDADKARQTIKSLQDQLESLAAKPHDAVVVDGPRFEAALHDLRKGLRGLMAAAKESGDKAVDLVRDDVDSVQGRIGGMLNGFTSRERAWLRFAAKLFCRNEEVNTDDQYDIADLLQYYDESNYYTLQVSEKTEESKRLNDYELDDEGKPKVNADGKKTLKERKFRQLVLDALIHGYVDLSDYTYLHYEYEHIYATVSQRLLSKHKKEGQKLQVLFLGGGSYTFPRYLTAHYPKTEKEPAIQCDIAEIDPRVTATVRKSMGMNLLKDKRICLLSDAMPTYEVDGAPGELQRTAAPSLWTGLKTLTANTLNRKPTHSELKEQFVRLIAEAGAVHVRSLDSPSGKKVDYAVDLRSDKAAPNVTFDKAVNLKIEVLDPAQFMQKIDTSPFDNIVTYHMDARQFIMQNKNKGQYDVIYGDAFNDFSVPSHLTTLEFNEKMAELLKPDGIFMANVIDKWLVSKFMGAYLNTLEKVFKHVYLLKDRTGDPGKSRDTFVIICSNQPVDLEGLGDREEDIQGLVGDVMSPRLMKPVRRGGLRPVRRYGVFDAPDLEFAGNGQEKSFDLGMEVGAAAITMKHVLDPSEYSTKDKRKKTPESRIRLSAPLPKDWKLTVRLSLPSKEIKLEGDDDTWFKTLPNYDIVAEFREPGSKAVVANPGIVAKVVEQDKIEVMFLDKPKPAEAKDPKADTTKRAEKKADHDEDRNNAAPSYMSDITIKLKADPASVEFTGDGKTTEYPLPIPKMELVWSRLLDDRDLATMDKPDNDKEKADFTQKETQNTKRTGTVAWKGPSYEIKDGRTLTFTEPPPAGFTVAVKRYTNEKIILTDRYCPVDIMLAEVAATRLREEEE